MSSPDDAPRIGILSIGDMGVGIARLLMANGFVVATNCKGRSQETVDRAKAAHVRVLETDVELVDFCDVVLSVVPPRDADATAQRVVDAALAGEKRGEGTARPPVYLADMNAVSPASARRIAASVERSRAPVRLIDGCILGHPPSLDPSAGDGGEPSWTVPLMPTSGPHSFASSLRRGGDGAGESWGVRLESTLRARHISDRVGSASGLKMCFASLSKGFAAIAVQTFTTAHRLGVLPDLRAALAELSPARARQAEAAVAGVPPKAYRWVREMEEISDTHAGDGGFRPELIFQGAAAAFRAVAEDPVLGQEKIGSRKRGLTVEDFAEAMSESLDRKRKKTD